MRSSRIVSSTVIVLTLGAMACSSAGSSAAVPDSSRRVLGRENDVRVDAAIVSRFLSPNGPIKINYQIQNFRTTPITILESKAETSYDESSGTITIALGAELPDTVVGNRVTIQSGEKRSFSGGAVLQTFGPQGALSRLPRFIRIKVHLFADSESTRNLVAAGDGAGTGRGRSFDEWMSNRESVVTNSIPISWSGAQSIMKNTSAAIR